MQHDFDTVATARPVRILGVNEAGQESGNVEVCQGRTLPWLQDLPRTNVWHAWHASWRDVIILDEDNRVIRVYNLTDHDLSVSANYAELRGILIGAAQ